MKTLLTTLLMAMTLTLTAQSPYEKAMTRGLEMMSDDMQKASQQFERVANAEKENWLPAYYVAFTNVISATSQNDKEKTLIYMNKAQKFIDLAESLSPNNVEIMVLQGLLNTSWIQYDSGVYGMKLAGATTAIYDKAKAMAPSNPRVISSRAQWLMGMAKFFGKEAKEHCADIEKAITLFKAEKQTDFNPSWGLKGAQETQTSCK